MSLTMGTAPFGPKPAGRFNDDPAHVLYWEDSPRRVRTVLAGETVADSRRVKLLHEKGHLPVYYFPLDDVRRDVLEATDHTSHCPHKGQALYWTVRVGDRAVPNAVWSYPEPIEGTVDLAGYAAFYWDLMDEWYEEDDRVYVHARDPYHRIDVLESSRHVKISMDDEVLAESHRPLALFETGLPTRWYLPEADVRTELLVPTDTRTECPYKGRARYFSVKAGEGLIEDLVWLYEQPLDEAARVAGRFCFYSERVATEVDGQPVNGT